ncbi:MAG: DNA primase [Anaerolineales bacterium]|nr:DNA primase [Anaerolineales bacterium]
MSVIDDIKSRLDLVELISETVKLRKSGRTLTGLCPFHPHKNNTPSFAVWPDSGNWRCFGQCNEGGDAFKFIMKRDGVDFAEALRSLAQRTGVVLTPRSPEQQERDDSLDHLRRLLDDAAVYYHHLLKNSPGAQHARAHVAGRGLSDKAVEMFQLGYAPDAWDAALKYFTAKGYAQQDLLDAGLIVVKDETENVKVFDRFRDRLMIPVRDERGRMTGFQARALKPDALPKFMNSPQTALFDKGRTLFGLDLARKAIREAQAAIVVEGNLDVVAAHQAGFANVVSSQGTALTEHQMRLLKKHAPRIILALDADAAGDAATLRGLNVAREALDRESEITFDPRGLVKTEGRLGADLRVMTLPPGLDPDDVINANPEQWRQIVADATPVVAYVIRVLTTGRDLDDPKVKTEIAATVLPLIEDVAQPIERDTYRQKLARVLRVDERSLAVRATGSTRRPTRHTAAPGAEAAAADPDAESSAPSAPAAAQAVSKLEAYCLGALLAQPDLLYKADRELQQLGLPKLAAGDFVAVEHQLIFGALTAALEQVDHDPVEYVRLQLDPTLQPRLAGLLAAEAPPESLPGLRAEAGPTAARTNEELLAAVLRLRKRTIDAWLRELRFLAEDAGEQGDVRAEAFQQEISRQAVARDRVDRALARRGKRGERPPKVGLR